MHNSSNSAIREFTPAAPQLWLYDPLVALLTRESVWRRAILHQIAPTASDVIVDVGCGTGSQLKRMAEIAPTATLIGIDPDAAILQRARRKTAGMPIEYKFGFSRDVADLLQGRNVNKIVSSLVFHHMPIAEKRIGLAVMREALVAGGELHVADYGRQRTRFMRTLFRVVQYVDGFENTEPNAQGILPVIMAEVGFQNVSEVAVISTPTGSISIYRATRER